ncbi:alpha/beta hydrolase [Acholeplasma sp. OttesenSCG-928-E16]|nr:alpha/beta hydrolase [Acholeplasma sp. OttesenSCG-928-E16]
MRINGNEVFVQKDYVDNPKGTVIIVHGLAEHCGRYDHVVEALNKAQYDCLRYDHRGHGKSSGKRGKLKSFHNLVDDLHELVKLEKARSKKVFLLGHSMGGSVVNIYDAKYHDVDGIISSAAATNTPEQAKILRKIGFWWLRWVSVKNELGDKLSRDPNVVIEYESDPYNLRKYYLSLAGEVFVSGYRYLKKNYSNMIVPILYLHGKEDKIVDASFSTHMHLVVPAKDKEIILYEGAKHEIFNEINKEEVIADCINWLDRH